MPLTPGTALAGARQYADAVLAGEIVACRFIHLAAQRFLDDWEHRERKGFKWSDERADHALETIGYARHFQGKEWTTGGDKLGNAVEGGTHPQRFTPEPWQAFIIANLFGWLVERDGKWLRRFTKVYIEVARKNGKSFMVGALANYLAFWDNEHGAQGFSAATHRDQAKIVYRAVDCISQKTPEYEDAGVISRGDVETPRSTPKLIQHDTRSTFEPLGQERDNMDGYKPHVAVVDEYHQHKNDGVVDAMETGMGSKGAEPMLLIITTAGDSLESACGHERNFARQVLETAVEAESYFAAIFTLDAKADGQDADDWTDEAVWRKSNPGLDTIVSRDYLRAKVAQAVVSPAKQAQVKRKHFDLWCEDERESWIPLEVWDRCKVHTPDEELDGETCWLAADLAAVNDTAALVRLFPPTDARPVWVVRPQFYLPEHGIAEKEKRDRASYLKWASDGLLRLTPGDRIDYDVIMEDVRAHAGRYKVAALCVDPWNATHFSTMMQKEGLTVLQIKQDVNHISPAAKEFERLVRGLELDHGANSMLRWQVSCAARREYENENLALSKRMSTGRVDGLAATITAIYPTLAGETGSQYNRGARLSVRTG